MQHGKAGNEAERDGLASHASVMLCPSLTLIKMLFFTISPCRNIEEILAAKGEHAKRIDSSSNMIEISAEDIVKLGKLSEN